MGIPYAGVSIWQRSWRVTLLRQATMLGTSIALFAVLGGPIWLFVSGGTGSAGALWDSVSELPLMWWMFLGCHGLVFSLVAGVWLDHIAARKGRRNMSWIYPLARTVAVPIVWVPAIMLGPVQAADDYASWFGTFAIIVAPFLAWIDGIVGFFVASIVRDSFPPAPAWGVPSGPYVVGPPPGMVPMNPWPPRPGHF